MKVFYIVAAVLVAASVWIIAEANELYDLVVFQRGANETLRSETQSLEAEAATLASTPPWPLRFSDDALSELFSRAIEAGEVLGAGVRIEPRDTYVSGPRLTFAPFRQGIQMAPVTAQIAMRGTEAPALLAIFEEELRELQIAVRKLSARQAGNDVAVSIDIDVFGRAP